MDVRVVIAGSRGYEDYSEAKAFIEECLEKLGKEKRIIVLSGTAKGADALGERYAREKGWSVERYPADWKKYGKAAGPKRNEEMAKAGDAVICFWDGASKGTRSMIDAARRQNKTLFVKTVTIKEG